MVSFKNLNISKKLIILTSLILSLSLISLTFFVIIYSTSSLKEKSIKELETYDKQVLEVVEIFNKDLSDFSNHLNDVFKSYFKEEMSLDLKSSMMVGSEQTPIIKSGNTVLNMNFSQVDHFTSVTSAVATVFVRRGDDFIRVTTSLKKEDGTRAIGTKLDKTHPAYDLLLRGEKYTGRAILFSKYYMTTYVPIIEKNNIIGVFYIGLEFTEELKSLKERIKKFKIGTNGYVYVLNTKEGPEKGNYVIHPTRENQSILGLKSDEEQEVFKEMIEKKNGNITYKLNDTESSNTNTTEKIASYITYAPWNWIVVSSANLDEILADYHRMRNYLFLISFSILIVSGISLYFVLSKQISRPLNRIINGIISMTEDLSSGKGDLTKRINYSSQDELGKMAKSINTFIEMIHKIISTITDYSLKLAEESKTFSSISEDMEQNSQKTYNSMESFAASIEEVSASLSSVSATVTQIHSSLFEVSKSCLEETQIAQHASEQSKKNEEIMIILENSSHQISKIIDMINSISEQTNLLALNATIESARAGEAGKGFAVVANEVKELSKQTQQATVQVTQQISEIQTGTKNALNANEKIMTVINDINNISNKITSSIDEEASSLNEISSSISQIDEVTKSKLSHEIKTVSKFAFDSSESAKILKHNAHELSQITGDLEQIVKQFKI